MRYLVTGVAGFIGSHLLETLLEAAKTNELTSASRAAISIFRVPVVLIWCESSGSSTERGTEPRAA